MIWLDTLVQGKAILHSITIPEGLTSEQIMARLAENEIHTSVVSRTRTSCRSDGGLWTRPPLDSSGY